MNQIERMMSELRDLSTMGESMLSQVPPEHRAEMTARQEFSAEIVEAFSRFVDKLNLQDGEAVNPPDLFTPAALTAGAICTKVIRHLHPLGACSDCSQTALDLFSGGVRMGQVDQDDDRASRH